MRIIDTKGQLCPAPLIAAKRALKETVAGESFAVLTDNKSSFDNLSRFLKDNKAQYHTTESEGTWTMTITKSNGQEVRTKAEDYCTSEISHFQKGNFVIVFSSDRMGDGDDQLGKLLISNFIKALKDLEKLPAKILFYNSGVKLVTNTSPVIEHLQDLEKMGVELMLCATCVSYYSLDSLIGAGILSNMYSIAEAMATAGSVIKP
jgi:selenium metabolism protein YedF